MFKITPGEAGHFHRSRAEANAAKRLRPLGIVPYDRPLPVTYTDTTGAVLTGKADFADIDLGLLFEWKPKSLNGKRSKVTADNAVREHMGKIARGFVKVGSARDEWHMLQRQFAHSASSVGAKQQAMHDAGHVLLLILGEQPDEATLKRIQWRDIAYMVEGSPEFRRFNAMRKLAKVPGISATARVGDWKVLLS